MFFDFPELPPLAPDVICKMNEIYNHLHWIAKTHQYAATTLLPKIKSQIVSKQYGRGGQCIHRGYYCPSPVLDILVGGINRGTILKRVIKPTVVTTYSFDSNDQLILMERPWNELEIVLRNGNVETGIGLGTDGEIKSIAECIYNESKIISYMHAVYAASEGAFIETHSEEYVYSSEGLDTVIVSSFSEMVAYFSRNVYRFWHDKNGFLSKYMNISCNESSPSWQHEYTVYVKRKI